MYNLLKKKSSGFSLVELLIVIAIIGILAGIIMASLSSARGKGRDTKRMTDLKQMELALKLYYEAYGEYPQPCNLNSGNSFATPGEANPPFQECINYIRVVSKFIPEFMSVLPTDPNAEDENNTGIAYRVDDISNPQEYKLMFIRSVETKKVHSYDDDFARCSNACGGVAKCDTGSDSFQTTYAVYHDKNPGDTSGPECW